MGTSWLLIIISAGGFFGGGTLAPTSTSKEQCFATVEMLSQLPIHGYAGICVSPEGKIYDKDNMQDAR